MEAMRESWTDDRLDTLNEKVDLRFDGVNERLEVVNEKFDRVDERFDGVNERFEVVNEKFDRVDERLRRLEDQGDQLGKAMKAGFDRVDARFESLHRLLIYAFISFATLTLTAIAVVAHLPR